MFFICSTKVLAKVAVQDPNSCCEKNYLVIKREWNSSLRFIIPTLPAEKLLVSKGNNCIKNVAEDIHYTIVWHRADVRGGIGLHSLFWWTICLVIYCADMSLEFWKVLPKNLGQMRPFRSKWRRQTRQADFWFNTRLNEARWNPKSFTVYVQSI